MDDIVVHHAQIIISVISNRVEISVGYVCTRHLQARIVSRFIYPGITQGVVEFSILGIHTPLPVDIDRYGGAERCRFAGAVGQVREGEALVRLFLIIIDIPVEIALAVSGSTIP